MRYKMNEEEKDMFEIFKRLMPGSKHILLLQAYSALAIEETVRSQYGLSPEGYPAQAGQTAAAQPERTGV